MKKVLMILGVLLAAYIPWRVRKGKIEDFVCLIQMTGCKKICSIKDKSPEKDVCINCYEVVMMPILRKTMYVNVASYCESCWNVGRIEDIDKSCGVIPYYCLKDHYKKSAREKGDYTCPFCKELMQEGKQCTYPLRLFGYHDVPTFRDEFLNLMLRRGVPRWQVPRRFMESKSEYADKIKHSVQNVVKHLAQTSPTK